MLYTKTLAIRIISKTIPISFSPASGIIMNDMDSGVYDRDHTVKQRNGGVCVLQRVVTYNPQRPEFSCF